ERPRLGRRGAGAGRSCSQAARIGGGRRFEAVAPGTPPPWRRHHPPPPRSAALRRVEVEALLPRWIARPGSRQRLGGLSTPWKPRRTRGGPARVQSPAHEGTAPGPGLRAGPPARPHAGTETSLTKVMAPARWLGCSPSYFDRAAPAKAVEGMVRRLK